MSLSYVLEATATGVPLSFAHTPVLKLPANAPPGIHRTKSSRREHHLSPRSLGEDVWLQDVTDNIWLGRVLSVRVLSDEKTRRFQTTTDVVVDIQEKDDGVMRAIRGRHAGKALWGHHVSLSRM